MSNKEKEDVLAANKRFYEALESGNMELMEEVWVKDSRAKCVHPGWPMLWGWEAIKQSWINIFRSGGPTEIKISNVSVEVSEKLAWVTCIEHIGHAVGDQIRTALAQTTNIYEKHGSQWLIIQHHASVIPMGTFSVPEGETVQ